MKRELFLVVLILVVGVFFIAYKSSPELVGPADLFIKCDISNPCNEGFFCSVEQGVCMSEVECVEGGEPLFDQGFCYNG